MRLHIAQTAVEQLVEPEAERRQLLKLVYDSEGCGCAVSGVPQLWRVDKAEADDMTISEGAVTVLAEKRHAVFFEDVIRLEYEPSRNCFVLKSDGQIYNSRLHVIDKTTSGRE